MAPTPSLLSASVVELSFELFVPVLTVSVGLALDFFAIPLLWWSHRLMFLMY